MSYNSYPKNFYTGYGYGQIDAYGNARHGYGFGVPYGPGAVVAGPVAQVEAPIPTPHPQVASLPLKTPVPVGPVGLSHSLPPLPHGNIVAHPAPVYSPSLSHGFGYGFSQF